MTADVGCGRISLLDYLMACRKGLSLPAEISEFLSRSGFASDLACFAWILGGLEPLAVHFPGIRPVAILQDKKEVPPKTEDSKPSRALIFQTCAPLGVVLVLKTIRVVPLNLTACEWGTVSFDKASNPGFRHICLPFEGDSHPGAFVVKENLFLCPRSGIEIYVENHNPCSSALFGIFVEAWAVE